MVHLTNHEVYSSTADLYYDATTHADIGSVSPTTKHHTSICSWGVFSYMRFLEYMGFVLAVVPLKYGMAS